MENKGFEILPCIPRLLENHVHALGKTQSQKRPEKTVRFHLCLIFRLSTVTDRTTSQKINKEIEDLNDTINQLHLRHLQNIAPKNIRVHSSQVFIVFSKIDHILSHKISLNKFSKIESMQSNFFAIMESN